MGISILNYLVIFYVYLFSKIHKNYQYIYHVMDFLHHHFGLSGSAHPKTACGVHCVAVYSYGIVQIDLFHHGQIPDTRFFQRDAYAGGCAVGYRATDHIQPGHCRLR